MSTKKKDANRTTAAEKPSQQKKEKKLTKKTKKAAQEEEFQEQIPEEPSVWDASIMEEEHGDDSKNDEEVNNDTKGTHTTGHDRYGRGQHFDRLQFGYSPANSTEAIVFHKLIPTEDWIEARKVGIARVLKGQKPPMHELNCESLASWFKLQSYHRVLSNFQARCHESTVPRGKGAEKLAPVEAADAYLKQLQRRQEPAPTISDEPTKKKSRK